MRLGQAAMEALRAEITGCLKPGDELVVACPVALKGTSVIAKNKKDKLAERFSAGFIQNCVSLWDAYGPAVLSGNCAGGRCQRIICYGRGRFFKCALEDGRSFRSRTGSRLP